MNRFFPLQGIVNIIFNPVRFWERIQSEHVTTRFIRNSYFIPVALLVSVSAFFGSLLYANSELSPVYSVLISIKCFLVIFIAVFATSYLLGEITNPLDLGRDFNISFRLVAFSIAPFMICQIMSRIFESLLFVNVLGLYGLYIFWIGAERMLKPPQYKKMPLLIAVAITFAVIYISTESLFNMLTDRFFYSFFA